MENSTSINRGKGLAALTPEQRKLALEKSMETKRLKRDGLLPQSKLRERTLRQRIKDKCLDCCCEQRNVIATCSVTGCALWDVRPYRGRNKVAGDMPNDEEFDI